jgi:hypothetical protein
MALRPSEPPVESQTAARSVLSVLAEAGRFNSPAHTSVSDTDLELTRPLQVFLLGLDDLRAGRGLEAARLVGWRYLVEHAGQAVALAETLVDPAGRHVAGQVNYGPFVAGTAEALRFAESLETQSETTPHLLHVPALYFQAVWLETLAGQPRLIPIAPTPPDVEPNRVYTAVELLGLLSERVRSQPAPGPRDVSEDALPQPSGGRPRAVCHLAVALVRRLGA